MRSRYVVGEMYENIGSGPILATWCVVKTTQKEMTL